MFAMDESGTYYRSIMSNPAAKGYRFIGALHDLPLLQRIPRQYHRLVVRSLISALVVLSTFAVYFAVTHRYPHTLTVETQVHHTHITRPPTPSISLKPFTPSPIHSINLAHQQSHLPWLAAVICAAQDVQRRMLIRSSWMRLFREVPFTPRFVVSNPGEDWTSMIQLENRTYGDLIVLDTIQEDDITANTLKTLEFYKWLLNSGTKYEFVTKLDTDLWLNAVAFWDRYLKPRLAHVSDSRYVANVNQTIIGELYFSDSGYATFAHGSIYTVTWDMVELLVSLQEQHRIFAGEDSAIGILMHKGNQRANFVNFRGDEKFDYDDDDSRSPQSAFARDATHPQARRHALQESAIAIHELKRTKDWIKVSECFTADGIKKPEEIEDNSMPPLPIPLRVRFRDWLYSWGLSRYYETMFETIPPALLKQERNGNWVCSDIWDLGGSPRGWQD